VSGVKNIFSVIRQHPSSNWLFLFLPGFGRVVGCIRRYCNTGTTRDHQEACIDTCSKTKLMRRTSETHVSQTIKWEQQTF